MQDKTTSEVAAAAAATTVDEGNAPAVQDFAATAAATAAVAAGCQIYPPTSFQVCGAIRDKYNQMGGPTSFLLFPKSNELTNPGNTGKRSEFIGGNIYWSAATGAHPVAHEFLFKWGDHGYETGFLKYPKTDEIVWFPRNRGGLLYAASGSVSAAFS
ncbi:LGFP repeat-containing protein [Gordonia sp. NPDC062954]|uniref:LGFP repeat-containing protein n=1 Tax=Gordonia sp. NPDC062954 TaxID=3364003 RepID=UPI0037C65897